MSYKPDYRDREFETDTPYTRMQGYVNAVWPDHVREHARMVVGDLDPGVGRYRYAAALTEYVHEEVEYSRTDDLWRADYVLDETKQGDCEDQATLLGSLLACRSFDFRFVVIKRTSDDAGHIMLETLFTDAELDDLLTVATEFYGQRIRQLAWESADNGYWLPTDAVVSPIVGVSAPRYFHTRPSGEITWKQGVQRDYLHP